MKLNKMQMALLSILGVDFNALAKAPPQEISGLTNRAMLLLLMFLLYWLMQSQAFAIVLGSQWPACAIAVLTSLMVIIINRECLRYELFEYGRLDHLKSSGGYFKVCMSCAFFMSLRAGLTIAISVCTLALASLALTKSEAMTEWARQQYEFETPCREKLQEYQQTLQQQMEFDWSQHQEALANHKENPPVLTGDEAIVAEIESLSSGQSRLAELIAEKTRLIADEQAGKSTSGVEGAFVSGIAGCGSRCAALKREKAELVEELANVQTAIRNAQAERQALLENADRLLKEHHAQLPEYNGMTEPVMLQLVQNRRAGFYENCTRPFDNGGVIRSISLQHAVWSSLPAWVETRLLAVFGLTLMLELSLVFVGCFSRVPGYSRALFLQGEAV